MVILVWEWCKNVWYSNRYVYWTISLWVWEWCKNVWYSNPPLIGFTESSFENDVKIYGTQTELFIIKQYEEFENDVKMYGTQTQPFRLQAVHKFENDVKMYGTQTENI